jgi:hypothetical protein
VTSPGRRDLLIVTCAVSAGVHAALAPQHLREAPAEGAGFVAAAVLLAVLVVALTYRPASRAALVAAALVFAGLLATYALASTTGIPLLHPDVEPVDGLGLATKAVEILGLTLAAGLGWGLRPMTPGRRLSFRRLEGARS